MRPIKISVRKTQQLMELEWADGERKSISLDQLRRNCPCAGCKQLDAERDLSTEETDLVSVRQAGNYALAITWADGHRFGIYTWDLLRSLPAIPEE